MNRWLALATALALAAAFALISCTEDVHCKLCDDDAGLSDAEQACLDMTKAFYACNISLSDLTADAAYAACVDAYDGQLAVCYEGCYVGYSRCTFWRSCVDACEDAHRPWAEPADDDDDDSAVSGDCRDVYSILYDDCGVAFFDPDGNEVTLEDVLALCEGNDPDFGPDGAIYQCIVNFESDCEAIINCIIEIIG